MGWSPPHRPIKAKYSPYMSASEKWRVSPDAPDYEISDFGRIRRWKQGNTAAKAGRIIVQHKDRRGYVHVSLRISGKRRTFWSHRLVCRAFHGDAPTTEHEASHIDGNRSNNHAGNLRWATHQENMNDQAAHGSRCKGEAVFGSKLTENEVRKIRVDSRSHRDIAADYGVVQQTISRIKTGELWAHVK